MSDTTTVADTRDYAALKGMLHDMDLVVSATESETGERDNTEFVATVMEGILNATSFEDVFNAQTVGMMSGKDFTDIPFYVVNASDISWSRSSRGYVDQGAFPFFAIMRVRKYEDDSEVTLNCGGKTFMATLWRLYQLGWFDGSRPQEDTLLMIRGIETSGENVYLQLFPYRVIKKKS